VSGREPAWRVFANELSASLFEEKGTGDRAASYLLSPLGARMNRVLMLGTLTPPEALGTDESRPFLRSRLTDPTGTITVTAGGFQPRALAGLKAVTADSAHLVVGKAHLYIGRNGTAYPSVRAEALRPVSEAELGAGWAEAVDQTLLRIELSEALRAGREPPEGGAAPSAWANAARSAIARYPSLEPGSYRTGLGGVLHSLDPARAIPPASAPATVARVDPAPAVPSRATVTRSPPPAAPAPEISAASRAQESAFLDIIDELADRSVDGYADLREATGLAGRRGISREAAERMLNRLEEQGTLEEPVVGKLRRS